MSTVTSKATSPPSSRHPLTQGAGAATVRVCSHSASLASRPSTAHAKPRMYHCALTPLPISYPPPHTHTHARAFTVHTFTSLFAECTKLTLPLHYE